MINGLLFAKPGIATVGVTTADEGADIECEADGGGANNGAPEEKLCEAGKEG